MPLDFWSCRLLWQPRVRRAGFDCAAFLAVAVRSRNGISLTCLAEGIFGALEQILHVNHLLENHGGSRQIVHDESCVFLCFNDFPGSALDS